MKCRNHRCKLVSEVRKYQDVFTGAKPTIDSCNIKIVVHHTIAEKGIIASPEERTLLEVRNGFTSFWDYQLPNTLLSSARISSAAVTQAGLVNNANCRMFWYGGLGSR